VSVGVAATARVDFRRERDSLMFGADAALYEAKRAGRDCVKAAAPLRPDGRSEIFARGAE
jgi:PleD family two-component response regulator